MSKEIPLISGQYYHIYNRGNNGENLFREERNYAYFFKLYIHYIYPIADTYAYCLMRNHFHLLVRMKTEAEIQDWKSLKDFQSYSQAFSNLFSTYTKAINKAYHRSGSLFEKNFNRILIDSDRYFIHLISYIHRNPQKHGFTDNFRTYPYSSYQTIYQQKHSRLESHQVLQWFGNFQVFENYHQLVDDSPIRHLIEEDVTD
jgi:REP element-mobilizing transposase RayT